MKPTKRPKYHYLLIVPLVLPFLVYPFVLLANLMTAAAYPQSEGGAGTMLVVSLFLIGTTAYPLVIFYVLYKWKKNPPGLGYIQAGYAFLGLILTFLLVWYIIGD